MVRRMMMMTGRGWGWDRGVQVNSFEARRLGAALVAANVAKMMHRHFLQVRKHFCHLPSVAESDTSSPPPKP